MVKVTSKEGFETYQLAQDSASDLRVELFGYLPNKVRSITISGAGFNRLADGIFDVSIVVGKCSRTYKKTLGYTLVQKQLLN